MLSLSSMQTFSLDREDAHQRLDRFLRKLLPNAPLSSIYRLNRTGKVKVNGKKLHDNTALHAGDIVTLFLEDAVIETFRKNVHLLPKIDTSNFHIQQFILYEDEHLLILNKPAGMNVHPGDHKSHEVSLIEHVHDALGKHHSLTFEPALVHRLDRDTSGAIMIAKNKETLLRLLSLIQTGRIEKVYHALVLGTPPKPRDTIRVKLTRIENANHEAKVQIDPLHGQKAITHYRILKNYEKYCLLECRIETGRTHQIRVHLASLGCPILGDTAY